MKYIGHLDVMRYFQKAIRRAGMNVSYSGGFHPHMLMSFALPLSVGVTSTGEYFDLDLNEAGTSEEMTEALNRQMADGIRICSVRRIPEEKKDKAMSLVAAADYIARAAFSDDYSDEEMNELIRAFMDREEILISRKTKKGERTMNIRPLIYRFVFEDGRFLLRLSAGSKDNLRPEYVINTLADFAGTAVSGRMHLHRLELFAAADGDADHPFISLEELGEEIVSTSDHSALSE